MDNTLLLIGFIGAAAFWNSRVLSREVDKLHDEIHEIKKVIGLDQ